MAQAEESLPRDRRVLAVLGDLPPETEKLRLWLHRFHCRDQLLLASYKANCTVDNASRYPAIPEAEGQGPSRLSRGSRRNPRSSIRRTDRPPRQTRVARRWSRRWCGERP